MPVKTRIPSHSNLVKKSEKLVLKQSSDHPTPQPPAIVIFKLLRIHQWTKNLFCYAGVIFGGFYSDPLAWLDASTVFLCFCAISSAIYVFNDICDRKADSSHPKKKHRPIANGTISVPVASTVAILLGTLALAFTYQLNTVVFACLVAYVLNNLLYSLYIKHIAILDVMSIATGFCLRLLAGVYILSDIPTTWIIICTFFLATFLGFAKRHSEYFDSDTLRKSQRPVLISYTPELLNSLLNNSAVMIILSYALFTTSSGKNPTLVVTVPVVFFAVMYYTKLVLSTASTSEPDLIILKNRTMQLTIVLWLILYLSITSQHLQFFR